jgi:hypothetical protein
MPSEVFRGSVAIQSHPVVSQVVLLDHCTSCRDVKYGKKKTLQSVALLMFQESRETKRKSSKFKRLTE